VVVEKEDVCEADGLLKKFWLCRQGRRKVGGMFPAFRDCSRFRTAGRIAVGADILKLRLSMQMRVGV
jgi:hypothetical protein